MSNNTVSKNTASNDTVVAPKSLGVRTRRLLVVGMWVAAIGGWVLYQRSTGLSTTEALQDFVDTARGAWWAAAVYLILYALRPLVLFPAILITIAAGILFGSWWGLTLAVVGSNLSAMVAYGIGRSLTSGNSSDTPPEAGGLRGFAAKWSARMRERSFFTVMLTRLLFVPYDLVNYAAGALRIAWVPFLAATAIGSLPGTVAFVLAGASIERVDEGLQGFDLRVFLASVALFIVSWVVAKVLQAREDSSTPNVTEGSPA